MKTLVSMIMRSPQSAVEDIVGLTAIFVMVMVTLHIVPVL